MALGKWITGLTEATLPEDAARLVLETRLQAVLSALDPSLAKPGGDPEPIHQLRVSTRRARAAIDVFRAYMPKKIFREAKWILRELRRAGGDARDWDVFLIGLAKRRPGPRANPGAADFLRGYAWGQRTAAQSRIILVETDAKARLGEFLSDSLSHLDHTSKDDLPTTLIELARPILFGLLNDLDAAMKEDLTDYANLHQVRIQGKRLRYAMEVFAACFPPQFRETIYPTVEAMQEILGRANDSHVACRQLEELKDHLEKARLPRGKRIAPAIEEHLQYHRRRLPRERRAFLKWWQGWRSSGMEDEFRALVQPG